MTRPAARALRPWTRSKKALTKETATMASINRRTIRWTTQHDEPRTSQKYEAVYRDRAGKRHRRLFDLKRTHSGGSTSRPPAS